MSSSIEVGLAYREGEAGRIMAPHSVRVVILRRWIRDRGVSRATRIRALRSLSITSAHRDIRESDTPEATRPMVPIDAGAIIIAEYCAEPLAGGAKRSEFEYSMILSDWGICSPSQAMTSRAWAERISAIDSTLGSVIACSRICLAYIAPLAAVIAMISFMEQD